MKNLSLLLILVMGSVSAAEPINPPDTNITQDTVQSNDAINNPTSVMQNTQINSGVTHDSYGGGVSCSRTTLQAGVIQSFNGAYDEPQVYVGFNMPLGDGDTCETAAQKQISLTHQRTMALQSQIKRDNEMHDQEIKKRDLQYADLLAKICMTWHKQIVAERDSTLESECKQYSPLYSKHGHKDADSFDKENFSRISDHSH